MGAGIEFKGRKDTLVVLLDDKVTFAELESEFAEKLAASKDFFGTAHTQIEFSGRQLTEDEQQQLLDLVRNETRMRVKLKENVRPKTPPPPAQPDVNVTRYLQGGLRGGQRVRFNGSVTIVGDVNPGAEVVADGNIVVLGALSGMAHAGCLGDERMFVSALHFSPSQLRIADIVAYLPTAEPKKVGRARVLRPAIAYIENKKVFIRPLIESERKN